MVRLKKYAKLSLVFIITLSSVFSTSLSTYAASEVNVLSGIPSNDGLVEATDGSDSTFIEFWNSPSITKVWMFPEPDQDLRRMEFRVTGGDYIRILFNRNGSWIDFNGLTGNSGSTFNTSQSNPKYFELDNIDGIRITYSVSSPYYTQSSYRARLFDIKLFALVQDLTPPSVPANLQAVTSSGQTVLTWGASSDNVALEGYNIYRNNVKQNVNPLSSLSYTATSPNNSLWAWEVTAVDTSGNESGRSNAVTTIFDTVPPSTPTGLVAANAGSGVRVSWSLNSEQDVRSYNIYRGGNFVMSLMHPSTSYVFTDLTVGSTVSFQASAVDQSGNESERTTPVSISVTEPIEKYMSVGTNSLGSSLAVQNYGSARVVSMLSVLPYYYGSFAESGM